MNTIVCNTAIGAVTEYTGFGFQSITPTHAGDAAGLYELKGETDAGRPIEALVQFPRTLRLDTRKKHLESVYYSIKAGGQMLAQVRGEHGQWEYPCVLRSPGQSRAVVGRGIRENYLGVGFRTPDGQAFRLDRVEVLVRPSSTRRI